MPAEPFALELCAAPASGTAGDQWGTPPGLLEMARQTLGGIELDPASNAAAQYRVCAGRWCSANPADAADPRWAGDGLCCEWRGRVWLNPPYSRELIAPFTLRLLAEYDAGRTTAALLLVNVATSARWFRAVLNAAHVCWLEKRVAFLDGNGTPVRGNAYAQACFYLGSDPTLFAAIWGRDGKVCAP